jgi:hypothetical protein
MMSKRSGISPVIRINIRDRLRLSGLRRREQLGLWHETGEDLPKRKAPPLRLPLLRQFHPTRHLPGIGNHHTLISSASSDCWPARPPSPTSPH